MKEIDLLKKRIEDLEKIVELQSQIIDTIKSISFPIQPYIIYPTYPTQPVYPNYPFYTITCNHQQQQLAQQGYNAQ